MTDEDEQASIMSKFRNGLDKPSSDLFNSIFGEDLVDRLNWSQDLAPAKPANPSPAKPAKPAIKKKPAGKGKKGNLGKKVHRR